MAKVATLAKPDRTALYSARGELLRDVLNLSVAAVARWAGVTEGAVTKYEDGETTKYDVRLTKVYKAMAELESALASARGVNG